MSSDEEYENAVQAMMNEYMPQVDAALSSMNCLQLSGIHELKNMNKPPHGVDNCILAIATILGVRINEKKNVWPQLHTLLSDKSFPDKLLQFDKDNIPKETKKKMRRFLSDESLQPEILRSRLATSQPH